MKQEQDFYAAMRERYAALTGAPPDEGTDIALRFHTLAGCLETLSARIDTAEGQLFAAGATGETLDAHAFSRGLSRKGAVCAAGVITFTRPGTAGTLTIPAGALCAAEDGAEYETTADAVIAAGQTSAAAPARAVRAGTYGNALAGTVTVLLRPSLPVSGVRNDTAFAGGCDAEPDEALRARVLADCASPDSGANEAFYEKIAMAREGVSSASAVAGGAGTVNVYAAQTGQRALPAGTLAALQTALDENRAVGFTVTAKSAAAVAVEISAEIAAEGDFDTAKASLALLLSDELNALPIGRGLTRARLGQLLMNSGLVQNYRIVLPAADISAGRTQVLRAGTLTLRRMGG